MTPLAPITALIEAEVAGDEHAPFFRLPLVGVSAAADPAYTQIKEIVGPHHAYPQDILPGVQSLVSFFIPFSQMVVASNRKSADVSEEWALAYVYGNRLINRISQKLVDYFTGSGIAAATVPATHSFDEKTLMAAWSHRSAAYIAGLGSFGTNRMLITKKGCAGRYGTVFVAAQLPATTFKEQQNCLRLQGKGCHFCQDNCPTGALRDGVFNRHKCYAHLLAVDAKFPQLGLVDVCGKCAVGPCAIKE